MIVTFTAHNAFQSNTGIYRLDTDAVIERCGNKKFLRRERPGDTRVDLQLPVSHFRKIVKMILKYANRDALDQFDEAWRECSNDKVRKVWNDEKAKSKRFH